LAMKFTNGQQKPNRCNMSQQRKHVILGPVAAMLLYLLMIFNDIGVNPSATAAITLLTAWWWATEALPVPATSLVPFTLFPLAGVLDHKTAASGMGSHIILLMLGGFLMAKALERSGAHQRFAIMILRSVGTTSVKRLIAAFMLTAAFLSMWISNTATCLMLMPIVLACLKQVNDPKLTAPLVISVAYACSIGGIATLVGTPPNVIFAGIYQQVSGTEFGFLDWMMIGVPIVTVILPISWLWLSRNVKGPCEVSLPTIGAWSQDEKRVISVFALIVFLWIFRSQPFGGWTNVVGASGVGDATVAMLGATLMFVVRSEKGEDMILNRNMFIEGVLPSSVIRKLTDKEMDAYRAPHLDSDDRQPLLNWPRQIPIEGEPKNVVDLATQYSTFMAGSEIPKLFINADPGSILVGPQREFCRSWPNQQEVTVKGLHFIQEDSPVEIGQAVASWLKDI